MVEPPLEPHATLQELQREINDSRIVGDPATEVRDVRHDSREVERGDIFVARKGQHSEGDRFVRDAIAKGAAAVIVEREHSGIEVPQLVVRDAATALAFASSAVWRHPSFSLEVLGITGTNGKTTTSWLIEQVLNELSMKTGLLGTVEHRYLAHRWPALHTTPESDDLARRMAAMRSAGAENVVMEVSSHALALGRVEAVRFRVAALTNVTQDHLDFHSTFDAYAAAKRRLFTDLGPAMSVLNVDDPTGARWAREGVAGVLLRYSARGANAEFRVREARFNDRGLEAEIDTPDGAVALRSALAGWHNLENLLCAMTMLYALEVPATRSAPILSEARSAPGRLERVQIEGAPAVFVDYAHTPDALANVLRALRATTKGRIVCVFGCGGDRDPTKRAPMGAAVANGADVAVLTTDNPRTEDPAAIAAQAKVGLEASGMREGAIASGRGTYLIEFDREAAIMLAVASAQEGDVVLVAGKGHEPYQEVHGVRRAFDDREVSLRALQARAKES